MVAPGGGVPRYSNQDYSLAGYSIPAKLPVTLDPRIGNKDPNLFVEPLQYEPLRWVPRTPPRLPSRKARRPVPLPEHHATWAKAAGSQVGMARTDVPACPWWSC